MVKIAYTNIDCWEGSISELFQLLPIKEQQEISKIKSREIQRQKIVSKLLLLDELINYGFDATVMLDIKRDERGKPYINEKFWFNISHSFDMVIVIISDEGPVGIDIEKIRPIKLNGFKLYFSEKEWKNILESENASITLLKKWTARESFLKALGRGFTEGVDDIEMDYDQNKALLLNSKVAFYFNYLKLSPDYIIAFSSIMDINCISIREFYLPKNSS